MAEKLLIVDDEADTLKLVSMMLQRQGYAVATAKNGIIALEKVKTEKPDLILLDVMMPDMDGYEVARRLRADPKTERIPIIMFTAKTQVEDKITGLDAGADVYLTKPTQPRELFAQVKAVLARTKKIQAAVSTASLGKRGVTIGILAAKGGMGVSTIALNLGVVLYNQTRKTVIVAELRPGYGGISLRLGYPDPNGMKRLLQGRPNEINAKAIDLAMITHKTGVQFLLASPHPRDAVLLDKVEHIKKIVEELPYRSRYVVLDLGAALPAATQAVLPLCDETVILVEPSPGSTHQSRDLAKDLVDLGVHKSHIHMVLVNRVRSSVQLNWAQVQKDLGYKISTVFTPAPELAYQAAAAHQPMVLHQPGSITTQQFEKLAALVTQRPKNR